MPLACPPSAFPCPDQSVQFIFPPLPLSDPTPILVLLSHGQPGLSQCACMCVDERAGQLKMVSIPSPCPPHPHPSDLLSSILYFTDHPQQRSSWEEGKKNGMSGPGKVRFRIDKGLGQEGCLQPHPG